MSTIGVVVLTHNRAVDLAATLARMCALPEHPRLVVVDNASTDATAELVRTRFPDVALVRLDVNAGAAGRNAGVARLDSTYVAFCDDDAWWAPRSLERAAATLDANPRLGLVCGRVLVGDDDRLDAASAAMARSPLRVADVAGTPILGFLCSASMVRREAFVAAGGFEPRFFLGGEEELLAIDLAVSGWALAYAPDIVVHHHPSERRDAVRRGALLLRNALWVAWLRRPLRDALRHSASVLARTSSRRERTAAILAALRGLPWVIRRRRVVPLYIQDALRRLDDQDYAERRRRRRELVGSGTDSGLASGSSNRLAR